MIINISSSKFKQIFDDEQLFLPIRWDGEDFISTLEALYHDYQNQIEKFIDSGSFANRECCSYQSSKSKWICF